METPGFFDYTMPLVLGAATTLKITAIAEMIALTIGVVVGSALLAPDAYRALALSRLCRVVPRGISALIQLFFIFFVLPERGFIGFLGGASVPALGNVTNPERSLIRCMLMRVIWQT